MKYSTTTGGAGRDGIDTGAYSNAGQDRGAGGREEVEGWAEERGKGKWGTETGERREKRSGDLDGWAAAAEDEVGGWKVSVEAEQPCCCPASSLASRHFFLEYCRVIK